MRAGDRVQVKDWHPDVPGRGLKWQNATVEEVRGAMIYVRTEACPHLTAFPADSQHVRRAT